MDHSWCLAPIDWFEGNVFLLAQQLLGCLLVHAVSEGDHLCGIISETEVYVESDPASHSFRGPTARNASVYLSPGHVYVYQIYGIHHCFNISAAKQGQGAAVLIRSLIPYSGDMKRYRSDGSCTGPGRLCQSMQFTRSRHDGLRINNVPDAVVRLYVPREQQRAQIYRRITTKRIGLNKAKHLFRRYCSV